MRSLRTRTLLVVAIAAAAVLAGLVAPAIAGGPDPGTYWERVDGEYVKRYKPLRVDDAASSVPTDWQQRLPVPGVPLPFDVQAMEVGRITVDPAILGRIPLAGLSTLPADPNVIGPAGVVLDPQRFRDVMQVDLVLGAPLDQLPAGQAIGLAVLRAVDGQTAFVAPGTQFDGASVAERFVAGQGLQRLAVNPASGRFEPTGSDTVLFLDGDRARFWIPWADAAATNAIQVHAFQPGTQVADTSTGEPGTGAVLTAIDPDTVRAVTLAPRAAAAEAEAGAPRAVDTPTGTAPSGSAGTSPFLWILVLGVVVLLIAAALFFVPAWTGRSEPGFGPAPVEASTAGSVLQYAGEPALVGGHDIGARHDESPAPPPEVPEEVVIREQDAIPLEEGIRGEVVIPSEEAVPGPPTTLVAGVPDLVAPRVTPCEPERAAWTAAQRSCEQARFDAATAEADAADARTELDRLRAEYPPLDWHGTGGLDATMDTGEHVSDLDLRLGDFAEQRAGLPPLPPGDARAERSRTTREEARAEYDGMQRRAQPLRDRIAAADAARARAEEACATADAAREAYERCMGLWSQRAPEPPKSQPTPRPTPPPPPVGTGTQSRPPAAKGPQPTSPRGYEPPTVISGAGPGTIAAPPTPPGGCTTDKVQELGPREKFRVGRTLNLQVRGGPYRNAWDSVAPGFDRWASDLGYSVVDGRTLLGGGEQVVQVAGADVPQLLGEPMWRDFATAVVEVTAWVRFEEVTMVCERRWPCVDGAYGPALTTTRRVRQDRFTTVVRTLGDLDDEVAVDRRALIAFLRDVWKEFADGERRLAEWVGRCR